MDKEVKARIIAFIGDLDDEDLTPTQAQEASAIYNLLARKPGRQPGYSPKESVKTSYLKEREEASQLLAEAGPDGKELAS